jgi:hypothetical protein
MQKVQLFAGLPNRRRLMGSIFSKKGVAYFLLLFGAGDIVYQALLFNNGFSLTMALWGSFLEAGRWHDLIGGTFCIVAAIGLLRS